MMKQNIKFANKTSSVLDIDGMAQSGNSACETIQMAEKNLEKF